VTATPRYDRSILAALRGLRLPSGEFAVFGSGPLLVRGIIDTVADLDVIARRGAWDAAVAAGDLIELPEGVTIASCCDGAVTVGTTWAYGDFDVDELIDTAEIIAGLPFVRLEHVVAYKRLAGRPKDRDHLERIAAHRRSGRRSW
jgi:hypothetical protein